MPPLPPQERVVQRAQLFGFQRGDTVVLQWQMPARNAPPGDLLHIDRVDIYRLAESASAPLALTEAEFASRSTLITTQQMTDSDFGLRTVTYSDRLQFAGQPVRLRYAIRFVNDAGQKAAFSNVFLVEPASRIAMAPTSLSAELSQEAVTLRWTEPTANVDGSTPPNIIGYNVYRSGSPTQAGRLLNPSPVTSDTYADRTFEFGSEYFYFVRTVSLGTGAQPVESSESNIVAVNPADTFAPLPPANITLAATPTTISIFFPANPEPDVIGYRIYRSTDPDLPLNSWELLTPRLHETTTFQDARVESGRTYYYYITAEDRFGNVSEPSEVVRETVP
ncbi:MAG: hypothetical protein H0V76_02905 [Blastocatellia bacterium]|nr:hypothetical protein [Blastocatellia bacterium]